MRETVISQRPQIEPVLSEQPQGDRTDVPSRARSVKTCPAARARYTDLRSELSSDAPPLARLGHPLAARVIRLVPGHIDRDLMDLDDGCFGLMVLDGLLLVELQAGRAHIGWLVGAHDLIRPSSMRELVLTDSGRWRALTPARVALLDREFGHRAGPNPIVGRVLVNRAIRTSNWLFAKSLIASAPTIDERLLLLFALLGERWGRVTMEGVILRLPLTHAILAALCGARRPSVTMGLHALEREGLLSCGAKRTWLLRRPIDNGAAKAGSCVSDYVRALGLDLFADTEERPRRVDGKPGSGELEAEAQLPAAR